MAFRVGQKVVCVDAKYRGAPLHGIKKGKIYTIAGKNSHDGVTLVELSPGIYDGWYADRFHPLIEK